MTVSTTEISLPTKTIDDRMLAAAILEKLWQKLRDDGAPVVTPVLGHTGYLDRQVKFDGPAAIGTDEHGRKAIFVKVQQISHGHTEQGQLCLFERHSPTSGVWVQGTPNGLSFLYGEAGLNDAMRFASLVGIGAVEHDERRFELL